MNNDLTNKLEMFYRLSEHEQQETLTTILIIANSNPEQFIQAIQNETFDRLNHLPIIYEALAQDLDKWSDFFLNELNRLLETARKSKLPYKILNNLEEFAYIYPNKFKHRDKFVSILNEELENEHPTFRYYAVDLLTDFVKDDDTQTLNKMRQRLSDSNWRIRYWTYMNLHDLGQLNKHDTLSWTDRIKSKWLDTLKFN